VTAVMAYAEKLRVSNFEKNSEISCKCNRDLLFFAAESRYKSRSLEFF
jgi:hypothetical protein